MRLEDKHNRTVLQKLDEVRKRIELVDGEIQELTDQRALLRRERDRLAKLVYEPRSGKARGNESLGVSTSQIIPIIEDYLKTHSLRELTENSGVPGRTIRYIRSRERQFTTFSIADDLLTVIGKQDLLGRDIPIVANPYHFNGNTGAGFCSD